MAWNLKGLDIDRWYDEQRDRWMEMGFVPQHKVVVYPDDTEEFKAKIREQEARGEVKVKWIGGAQ